MKKEMVEYLVDSFIDFNGEEHKIVACAVSRPSDGISFLGDSRGDTPIHRYVSLGISICNPCDKFDFEQGKSRAYAKAINDPKSPSLYTCSKGAINKSVVEAFLKQEVNFIKDNPERVIKGYNDRKKAFEKKAKIKEELTNLTNEEKLFISLIKNGIDVDKCIRLSHE